MTIFCMLKTYISHKTSMTKRRIVSSISLICQHINASIPKKRKMKDWVHSVRKTEGTKGGGGLSSKISPPIFCDCSCSAPTVHVWGCDFRHVIIKLKLRFSLISLSEFSLQKHPCHFPFLQNHIFIFFYKAHLILLLLRII